MRRIRSAFMDFVLPFCVPKLARFSAAFMPSILREWVLNFGLGFLCEIGSWSNLTAPLGMGAVEKRLGNCVELHAIDYGVMGFDFGIEKRRPFVRALGARLGGDNDLGLGRFRDRDKGFRLDHLADRLGIADEVVTG